MSQATPDEDRLFEEAMTLVIRLQNDPDNETSIDMVEEWRARSPAHEKAWAEIAEIHGMAGKVLKDHRSTERRKKLGLTRRNFMIVAGAGIGAYAASEFIVPRFLLAARADEMTHTAEIRRISLPDGSVATMGPDSAIALAYTDTLRRVDLLAGMAYFDVVSVAGRPFQVQTDHTAVTALGTAFDISSDAGHVTVSVNHGAVEIRVPGSVLAARETIAPGNWLSVEESTASFDRGARDPAQVGAWRDGIIVSDRETVAAVVSKIGRWQTGRIILADPALAARRVSGVFDLSRPVGALEAVVHPFGGVVRQLSGYLTVISTI